MVGTQKREKLIYTQGNIENLWFLVEKKNDRTAAVVRASPKLTGYRQNKII